MNNGARTQAPQDADLLTIDDAVRATEEMALLTGTPFPDSTRRIVRHFFERFLALTPDARDRALCLLAHDVHAQAEHPDLAPAGACQLYRVRGAPAEMSSYVVLCTVPGCMWGHWRGRDR